jgi:NAD(P)H dehydrogenase (quinone)
MPAKIQVIFYSMYGHVYRMAEAVAAGTCEAGASEVSLWQVPELVPGEILEKSGAAVAARHSPPCRWQQRRNWLKPTRSSSALRPALATWPPRCETSSIKRAGCGRMVRWSGKWGASSPVPHRSTAVRKPRSSVSTPPCCTGMIVVGLPYTEPRLTNMAEITGGTPYGATILTGIDGSRQPSENELAIARFQGRHVAQITGALIAGRKAIG